MCVLRRIALILSVLFCSTAFAQTAETRLYGEWNLDRAKTIALLKSLPQDDSVKAAIGIFRSPDFETRMAFMRDGTMTLEFGIMIPLHWRTIKEFSPAKIEIEIELGEPTDTIAQVEFKGPDLMQMTEIVGAGPVVFTRIKRLNPR